MATHSLENGLRHSQDQMTQLSNQWGQQAHRAHELSNTILSGQNNSVSVGSEEANSIRHAQELASNISANLSAGVSFGGNGIDAKAGMSSSSRDSLQHSLSEYQKYANELSHSSNQTVSDAFRNTSDITSSTSKTIQEATSRTQALSDINSNQSSINTNYSNDFSNYLRNLGYDPTIMTASEQTQLAQKFIENDINSKYGLANSLDTPTTTSSTITPNVPEVNSAGLQLPDSSSGINSHRQTVQSAIDEFNNHQGHVLGNQILEQGKVIKHAGSDAVNGMRNLFNDGHKDVNGF